MTHSAVLHRQGNGRMHQEALPRIVLSERTKAALDVARAVAACYVVLHHLAYWRHWTNGPGILLRFGQEAVVVFFLLSGFVIHANERGRALKPRGYFLRRIRRIYPTLLTAMAVSTIVIIDNHQFGQLFNWTNFFGTLLSVQDISALKPGVITDPYLGNDPLWSLSYEVAFYLVYPFVLWAWHSEPAATNALIGIACCAAYCLFVLCPNHFLLVIAYFSAWWCGAMAAEGYANGGRDFRCLGQPPLWLAGQSLLAALAIKWVGYQGLGFYPFLCFRHFVIALMMLVLLFNSVGARLASACRKVATPAAGAAKISYGLYVLHFPLLIQSKRSETMPGLLVTVVILVALAYVVDAQFNKRLPRAPST